MEQGTNNRQRPDCLCNFRVRGLGRSSDGQQVVDVVGVSPFLREKEARFLVEVERAAGSFKVLQPEDTDLVCDPSPRYRDSLLFIEAHLRRSVPTDASLVVGHRAAMDALPYQLLPAAKALSMPRQRISWQPTRACPKERWWVWMAPCPMWTRRGWWSSSPRRRSRCGSWWPPKWHQKA